MVTNLELLEKRIKYLERRKCSCVPKTVTELPTINQGDVLFGGSRYYWNGTAYTPYDGAGELIEVTAQTLLMANWIVNATYGFEITYTNVLINDDSYVTIQPDNDDAAVASAAGILGEVLVTDDTVVVYAASIPTTDIGFTLFIQKITTSI